MFGQGERRPHSANLKPIVVRDITKKLLEKLSYVLSNFRVLTPIIERSGALAESARKLDF